MTIIEKERLERIDELTKTLITIIEYNLRIYYIDDPWLFGLYSLSGEPEGVLFELSLREQLIFRVFTFKNIPEVMLHTFQLSKKQTLNFSNIESFKSYFHLCCLQIFEGISEYTLNILLVNLQAEIIKII